MNYKITLPELLSPAGSFEHLKAAVAAGADAVYFGGSKYGARAYAENFTKDKVIEGLDYLHFHDRRAYMTVNTLVKERELENLYEYLLPFYEAGLDGVIVQDMGAASFIRDHFKKMEVHGSTQMMITSLSGALTAKEMGMTRVVPARELSLEEVERIKKESGLELEVFIHGALCYCYSGQCLFSSMYGGRSGNRGRCAQPCRLPYRALDAQGSPMLEKEKHLLSPKDLYSLKTLPSMIEAGVDSLKIEGRMKNVDYVAGVTSVYRKYLDRYKAMREEMGPRGHINWQVDKKDVDLLTELYSRTGFTDGYWVSHNGSDMMSIDSPRHLGIPVGSIQSIQRNELTILLDRQVHPKDILVITAGRDEEIVLTVPSKLDTIMKPKKKHWQIILNAPKAKWLKAGLTVYRRHNEESAKMIEEEILAPKITYPVSAYMILQKGEPMSLSLSSRDDSITVLGPEPSQAQNRPIQREDILKQLQKTGNVPFTLEDFDLYLEEDLFVQASQLKDMRQKAYALLEQTHRERLHRTMEESTDNAARAEESLHTPKKNRDPVMVASVFDMDMLKECLSQEFFQEISLSMDFFSAEDLCQMKDLIHKHGKRAALSLPCVLRQESEESWKNFLLRTVADGQMWDAVYINNINEMNAMDDLWPEIPRIYGASFYQWNHASRDEILRLRKDRSKDTYWEFPYEMSGEECLESIQGQDLSMECLIYGRFPVMISAQCIKKTLGQCNHTPEHLSLVDRKNRKLPVTSHCKPGWTNPALSSNKRRNQSCYNMIWTDTPRNIIGEDYGILSDSTGRFRFDLMATETSMLSGLIESFQDWKRNAFRASSSKLSQEEHWNYGIE